MTFSSHGSTRSAQPEQARRLVQTIPWSLVFIVVCNLGILLIAYLMFPYSSGLKMFLGWLFMLIFLAIASGNLAKRLPGFWVFIGLIVFAIGSCIYVVLGGRLDKLFYVKVVRDISVGEADQYPNHDAFYFKDGEVDAEHGFLWIYRGTRTPSNTCFHVAPVVPSGWKETDPIAVWVAQDGESSLPPQSWAESHRAGYNANSNSTFRKIIEDNLEDGHLISSPSALIIYWNQDPLEAVKNKAKHWLWAFAIVDVLIFMLFLFPVPRAIRRQTEEGRGSKSRLRR